MTNILQPLDRSCFGHAKILFRRRISHKFCAGLSPTKVRFFETSMNIRKESYSSKTIIGGWRRCGLLENNPNFALSEYRRQMHHDVVMPEDLVQEESVIEPEVENISTPEPPKNHKKKNESFENTGESLRFKTKAALMSEIRNLQLEVKRARRAETEALNSIKIALMKLRWYENRLAEETSNHSGKRSRIPNPNNKVIRAVRMANSGLHSLVQQTDSDPTPDPTMGSK